MDASTYKPLFPYFGGKSVIAAAVWERFGDPPNYVEPFFGSGAVMFCRPTPPGVETVNDKDCFVSNLWRSVQAEPEEVAKWCDYPVNECDLHARHLWLIHQEGFRERMITDPDYYDVKVAGWWLWGICQWIGSGWCATPKNQAPHLQAPHLGNAGTGVHRKRPHLRDAGTGVHRPTAQILDLIQSFSDRMRRVRVCCGDWTRVLGDSPTILNGLTAVFLDPPYSVAAQRNMNLYREDDGEVADAVREWAIAHGENPMLRIALCGYDGEHEMPPTWEKFHWKAQGGYGHQSNGRGKANRHREVLWFSPHCLKAQQRALF